MSARKGGGYSSYSLNDSLGRPRTTKRPSRRFPVWPVLLVLLLGGGVYLLMSFHLMAGLASVLPFPKHLIAMRFQHNGQEVLLMPDTQCVVNPRDTLQLLDVQTDGWVSWGRKVVCSEFDVRAIDKKPLAIKDLLPRESFETPKTLEIEATSWDKPIGKISFLVQLDARDWVQKAASISEAPRKIDYLEKALQGNPGNVLIKTQLASLYADGKKYDEAARLYREIDEAGESRSVLEKLLSIYQAQNRVDDALGVYLDLLKLADDQDTFKGFLQYLQKHKTKDDAGRFLEKHQQDIPKVFQSSLLLVMADLNSQTKNWTKAAASYEKAIKAGVKDPDIFYNLAVSYQQSDDPEKAIQALNRYLQKNPNDIKSWLQLGALQEKKGALRQARATYETVLENSPQNKEAIVRLVAILEKSNDKNALMDAYEKLSQIQPKNRTVQYNLTILYYQSKKWDKAADGFEAIAAADPKDVESRKYLLDIYRKQKNEKGEFAMLQALSQLEPNNTSYTDTLFSTYDAKKDYKAIIALYRDVTAHHPDSVSAHNCLLYGLLKSGDNKGAAKELEQLIRLQPKEKKHLRQAANLYESSGDYGEALKKLDQILKLDPKDKEAKDDYLRLKMQMLSKKKPA